MCLGGGSDNSSSSDTTPAPPAETLKQAAPVKKTQGSASALSIGTKKYRNTGTKTSSSSSSAAPSGITLN